MVVHTAEDAVKRVVGDKSFVVKTSGGVLVRGVNRRSDFDSVLLTAAADTRYAFGPKITAIWFYDASRTLGERWIDLLHLDSSSKEMSLVDRNKHAATGVALVPHVGVDTGAILNSWDTADFLYICTEQPSGGVIIDTVLTNSSAAVMSGAYAVPGAFVAHTTFVDGSASGGVTLTTGAASATVSGEAITWTPQPAWRRASLRNIISDTDTPTVQGYWTRLSVGATLDSTVSITGIYAMAALTASATAKRGTLRALTNYLFVLDESVGGVEFIAVAAADTTVDIDWFEHRKAD